MDRRLALVTGASAGLGAVFARKLATQGYDLALTARRLDRLDALAEELRAASGVAVMTVAADLAQPGAVDQILAAVAANGRHVDVLINNAGYGLPGAFADTRWTDQRDFLQVMVTAPTELAHKTVAGMTQRGFGRIVNVASLAGLAPGAAGHTLYGAAKSYLIKASQSLHLETAAFGVHVSALCPGFTYSEFHDANGTRAQVSGATPRWLWMEAWPVVEAGWRAVEANKAICVPGLPNKALAALAKLVPDNLALAIVGQQSRRFRKL
jgi:short-subunit dehydrogenase